MRSFRRSTHFLLVMNSITHTADTACDSTVAIAAPCTPRSNTKMKSGSSTMLQSAPMSTVSMLTFANPCAVMNAFIPSVS